MADQKVSDLPSLNGVDVDPADLLYIVDSSAGTAGSKKITIGQFQLSPWSAGTVNGVVYFDGSKVPASGSALTFDGTNLGIGTSSPASKLHVSNTAAATRITITDDVANGRSGYIESNFSDALVIGTTSGVRGIRFSPDNTPRMFLDTSGNLGIGTSSPAAKLHVVGNQYRQNDFTGSFGFTLNTTSATTTLATLFGGSSFAIQTAGSGTNQLLLDASGNLGLGVTPSAWGSAYKALQVTSGLSLWSTPGGGAYYSNNIYFDGTNRRYIFSAAAAEYEQNALAGGIHKWSIAASGTAGGIVSLTQAMTLDASGNLGIGTATPSTKLSVLGGASGTDTRATIGNLATALQVGVDSSNNAIVATNTANNLGLYTNNLERVTIDSVGTVSVGINSNPNGYKFHVYATGDAPATGIFAMSATTPYGMNIYYGSAAPNNSNANTSFLYCNDTSALRIQLASNGGVINYQANNSNLSDRREKKDFAPAKSYLNTICSIPVQTFKYIDQTDDVPTLGVVAQDVQAVAPELVMESNWGTEDEPKMRLSIYQTDLQYALMKSIQELKTALDAANARIAALEAK